MKAIIPVAGVGTNLRPLTYTQPKPLIPVAGKPIISFIIDQLRAVGVRDFVFVIGYLGEKIKRYIEIYYPDINKEFVVQEERKGTGHAILTAKEQIQEVDELIIFFGDTIIEMDLKKVIATPGSCLAIKKVKEPRDFGVVEFESNGAIKRVVEKPKIPRSNMAMVGFYKIKEVAILLEGLEYNIQNNIRTATEFPLTDGLMRMIEKGIQFTTFKVDNWFDCGQQEVLLETNATLLSKAGYASQNLPPYDNTIIIPPVNIGQDCKIINSIIGPYVTIGNNARIESAIVKNSIIGNYAHIKEAMLRRSVIGNDTAITGPQQSLNIGDNTQIDFS